MAEKKWSVTLLGAAQPGLTVQVEADHFTVDGGALLFQRMEIGLYKPYRAFGPGCWAEVTPAPESQ